MKGFERLSPSIQFRHLQKHVETILVRNYELNCLQIELLDGCNNNAVFCVNARIETDTENRLFAFRMPRLNWYDAAAVASEARWLASICEDTVMVVPNPVLGRDGNFVQEIEIPGFPNTKRYCVLFRWVEGEFIDEQDLTPVHLRKVGAFTAHLHEHASVFANSNSIHQRRCDRDWLPTSLIEQLKHPPSLYAGDDRKVLAEATERILTDFHELDRTDAEILLIHADLHQSNYLLHNGEVRAIDFEGCGLSHPMFDLGSTIRHVENRGDLSALRNALFEGYANIRFLPNDAEKRVKMFELIRWLKTVSWEFSQSNFEQNTYAIRRVQKAVKRCKCYLQS